MSLVMVPITASMPSALAVYWITSNVYSTIQSAFFKVPGLKEALGVKLMPEIARKVKADEEYAKANDATSEGYVDRSAEVTFMHNLKPKNSRKGAQKEGPTQDK